MRSESVRHWGDQLGYLALVISPANYISIPNATNFQRPTDPGIFDAAAAPWHVLRNDVAITIAEIATQKIAHDEQLRQYNECQAVEMALRNQIISCDRRRLPPTYPEYVLGHDKRDYSRNN